MLNKRNCGALIIAALLVANSGCTSKKSDSSADNQNGSDLSTVSSATGDTTGMVFIKGGEFLMGSDEFPDSRPLHSVFVDSFWMDTHEVTNAEFARFVEATGYKTVAERPLDPKDYPGVPLDKLVPGSAVFTPPAQEVSLDNPLQWWE